tara:strand:+ start:13855 stop:13959 length:105 start_codon:yes stop_codon:yes gene_type:complete
MNADEFIDIVHRIFGLPRLNNSDLGNEEEKVDLK